jgi:hypothetical protein
MKRAISIALTSAIMAVSVPVLAQVPIGELQRRSGTTISGTVRSVVGNEFILDDGTGQIIVDAGPRWYQEINVSEGEQVTVTGEYDDYDFDAFSIIRSSGEVIQVRSGPGRPPWAGGPNRRR